MVNTIYVFLFSIYAVCLQMKVWTDQWRGQVCVWIVVILNFLSHIYLTFAKTDF